MNQKQKQELRRRQSTRQLMGIDRLTGQGVTTAHGELVFFLLKPDNLSVLSPEGVRGRVEALTNLLRGTEALRMLVLNSRASFQRNQDFYRRRLDQETLPALRELLRRDIEHLDDIRTATASVREFALVFRLERRDAERPAALLARLEKRVRDCGFHVRLAGDQDVKRLLAVYYQQDVTTEHFDGFDGEGWVTADG